MAMDKKLLYQYGIGKVQKEYDGVLCGKCGKKLTGKYWYHLLQKITPKKLYHLDCAQTLVEQMDREEKLRLDTFFNAVQTFTTNSDLWHRVDISYKGHTYVAYLESIHEAPNANEFVWHLVIRTPRIPKQSKQVE